MNYAFPKLFCLILIIGFIPPSLHSIDICIGEALNTVCNPFGKDSIIERKVHRYECVLEYILETRIVQTELFAKHFWFVKWLTFRRIVQNDEMKMLKISKNEMTEFNIEKLGNLDEAKKKTDECFSMNKEALLEEDENILSMEKLFKLSKNQLILSNKWEAKLDSLQKCLLHFLVNSKFYKYESIEPIFLDELEGKTREEMAILKANKLINDENNPNLVLRWKWVETSSQEPKPEMAIYEKGEYGFKALKRCEKFELVIKKNNGHATIAKNKPSSTNLEEANKHAKEIKRKGKIVAKEKEKIDLMKLLKYFNEEQLFVRKFPNVVIYDENKNISQKNCPICQEDFEKNEKLERLYCGHYYHWDCMQNSRKNDHFKCSLCCKNWKTLIDGESSMRNGLMSVGYTGLGSSLFGAGMSPIAQSLLQHGSRNPFAFNRRN